LGLEHSPEQIAGLIDIRQEAINRHIYRGNKAGGCLHLFLRCQKPYRKRCSATGRKRRGRIANQRPVDKRTAPIEKRAPVGHWEFDAIVGPGHAGNSGILAIPSSFRNASSKPGRYSQCRQLSCL
jgi:IS30 family transposase